MFTISAICSSSCSCIIMSSIGSGNAVVSGSSSQSAFTSRAVVVSTTRGTSYQHTLSRSDYISVRYHRTSLCVRSTVMEPTVNRRTHKISLPGRLHSTSDALRPFLMTLGIVFWKRCFPDHSFANKRRYSFPDLPSLEGIGFYFRLLSAWKALTVLTTLSSYPELSTCCGCVD